MQQTEPTWNAYEPSGISIFSGLKLLYTSPAGRHDEKRGNPEWGRNALWWSGADIWKKLELLQVK